MSHHCEETYDAYVETLRCAAKDHVCDACDEAIPKGARYFTISVVFEGIAESIKRCARCQTIHVHLRGLGDGGMWPDERLDCGEEYRAHWGVEPPPEIAALAFATTSDLSMLPSVPCSRPGLPRWGAPDYTRSAYESWAEPWKNYGARCVKERR